LLRIGAGAASAADAAEALRQLAEGRVSEIRWSGDTLVARPGEAWPDELVIRLPPELRARGAAVTRALSPLIAADAAAES
jgi:hypothetical protein